MVAPLGVLLVGLAVATIVVEGDVDVGPLGVLSVSPTMATIVVEEDVDGGTPRGSYRRVRQWPPL
jgi:hypothetical protein